MYQPLTNEEGPYGSLHFRDTKEEALKMVKSYSKLPYTCTYYSDKGGKMTMEAFIERFQTKGTEDANAPSFEYFDIFINQQRKPMTFTISPYFGLKNNARSLLQSLPYGKKILRIIAGSMKKIGKKAA